MSRQHGHKLTYSTTQPGHRQGPPKSVGVRPIRQISKFLVFELFGVQAVRSKSGVRPVRCSVLQAVRQILNFCCSPEHSKANI